MEIYRCTIHLVESSVTSAWNTEKYWAVLKEVAEEYHEIGEIFECDGVKLKVVEDRGFKNACIGCYFLDDNYNCSHRQKCFASQRKDLTSVKFIIVGDYGNIRNS